MQQFLLHAVEWVRREPGVALLAAAIAYLILLFLVLIMLFRMVSISGKQARLLRGADGSSLERMLLDHADTSQVVREQISVATRTSEDNAESLRLCLQRIGLVRFDAFADVGGEQSFALAVLDAGSNGFVVSGLYSRNDMRVYAKPVVAGVSPLSVTEEERKAIASAVSGGPVTQFPGKASTKASTGGKR